MQLLQLYSLCAHWGEAQCRKDYAKAQLRNEQQVEIVTPSFNILLMADRIIFMIYCCNLNISEKVIGDKYIV